MGEEISATLCSGQEVMEHFFSFLPSFSFVFFFFLSVSQQG
jgi:hypothetical protein